MESATKRKSGALALFGVNAAVAARERVENTGSGHRWREYPPLRRPSRLCATLRPLARRFAALTDASAAGVAGHEEHVCSSVLEKNQRATTAALAGGGAVEEVVDGGEDGVLLAAGQTLDTFQTFEHLAAGLGLLDDLRRGVGL